MAQFVEIDIDQGTDFMLDLGLKNDDGTPKDVSGYMFASSIKKSFYSLYEVASFDIDDTNAELGSVILSLSSEVTAELKPGRYLFDIKQIDMYNKVQRLAEGIVTVNPQITA